MTVKRISLTAMGVALFVTLALCLQVPVFENYYLCLGYVVLMVYCFYFGPPAASIVGTMGVVLYCFLINGLRGMPGWAAGNLIIAVAVSLACRHTAGIKNRLLRYGILLGIVIASTAVAILGVKSLIEMILYAQPFLLRAAKNVYAFVADIVVMAVSIPVCERLDKTIRKLFPLEAAVSG